MKLERLFSRSSVSSFYTNSKSDACPRHVFQPEFQVHYNLIIPLRSLAFMLHQHYGLSISFFSLTKMKKKRFINRNGPMGYDGHHPYERKPRFLIVPENPNSLRTFVRFVLSRSIIVRHSGSRVRLSDTRHTPCNKTLIPTWATPNNDTFLQIESLAVTTRGISSHLTNRSFGNLEISHLQNQITIHCLSNNEVIIPS